jgi:copper chaperone CopZ
MLACSIDIQGDTLMHRKTRTDLVVMTIAALLGAALALPGCKQDGNEAPAQPAATAPAATENAQNAVLHFDVAGMHCDGCVNMITTVVSRLDGVVDCSVSLEEESATVTVTDPALAETIIEAINSAEGYTAKLADA